MKKILFAFFLTLSVLSSIAQIKSDTLKHLTFKGIPIDGALKDFEAKLKERGLNYTSTKDGIAVFKGEFAGYNNCTIYAISHKNLVFRVVVIFPDQSTWSNLSDNYYNLKQLLIEKYGELVSIVKEEFQNANIDDDNSKIHEVKMNRCKFSLTTGSDEGVIELSISNNGFNHCFVKLIYEDKINSEIKKKQAKSEL